jgi:hypothetical protein
VLSIDLVRATADAARARSDIEVVGVCDTAWQSVSRLGHVAEEAAAALVKPMFGTAHPVGRSVHLWRGLPGAVLRPPAGDPNDPTFLELIASTLRPDASLWLGSVARARAPLLELIPRNVNYHNGELPALRGLRATAWSVYLGLPTTGFAFHDMGEEIDAGAVLVRGEIPVVTGASTRGLEAAKTAVASASLPLVLDALVSGLEGTPQDGQPGYYGQRELERVLTIRDPRQVTWVELERRLRAFERLTLGLPAGALDVTRVNRCRAGGKGRALQFVTADGVTGKADRVRHLPYSLYRTARLAGTLRPQRAR